MFAKVIEFFVAHKEIFLTLLGFIINEVIAANPKFFSGSIGQLIVNVVRKLLGMEPVSIPSPKQ